MSIGLYFISALIGSQIAHILILILYYLKVDIAFFQIAVIFVVIMLLSIAICFFVQKKSYKKTIDIMLNDADLNK